MKTGLQQKGSVFGKIYYLCNPYKNNELQYYHLYEKSYITIKSDYLGESFEIPLSFARHTDFIGIKAPLFNNRLGIKCNYKNSYYTDSFLTENQFKFHPSFLFQSFQASISLGLTKNIAAEFIWNHSNLSGEGRLFYQNVSFSKITELSIMNFGPGARLTFIKNKNREFSLEAEKINFNSKISGHIEFWPFTPTLVDLLGYRRYFLGYGDIEGYRWGIINQAPFFFNIKTIFKCHFIDIFTDGEFSSWQPIWLVFGKTDEQTAVLSCYRIQTLLAELSLLYRYRSWEYTFKAEQIIPIKIYKKSGIPTQPGYPEGKGASKSSGGISLKLSLVYYFK